MALTGPNPGRNLGSRGLIGNSGRMATAPNLLIVGDGPVTDALTAFVAILGWPVTVTTQARTVGQEILTQTHVSRRQNDNR